MPTSETNSRQETTGHITNLSYLVGYKAPLRQKFPTTSFQHPFSNSNPNFLHIIEKNLNSPLSNYSKPGPQFLDFRLYVPFLRCKLVQSQIPWLFCRQPWQWGYFHSYTLEVASSFCTFYYPLHLTSSTTVLWTLYISLNQILIGSLSESMESLLYAKILKNPQRNQTYGGAQNPPENGGFSF